jgi:receptor protein-tyrosine kinase
MVDEGRNTNIGRYYTLSIVDLAQPPTSPSSPNLPFNLVFGLVLGMIGGLGLSVLIEVMDTGLHSTSRIVEATSVPALGRIPALDKQQPNIFLNGSSPLTESFRQLRTTLFALGSDAPLKTLLVTSAQIGEGKSTIVSNLAYSMGHSGRQVVIVDGNLRRPTLHELFGVPNRLGLSNILTREVSLDEALQDSGLPGIQVLTSGPLPPHPAFLLDSHYMMELLDMLSARFDMVLIDSPPLLEFADTSVLALSAKNVLMVVERSQARQESLRGALQKLDEIKIEPLGLVVNRAEPTTQEAVSQMAILKSFKSLGQRKASHSKTG